MKNLLYITIASGYLLLFYSIIVANINIFALSEVIILISALILIFNKKRYA
jgi:Ca2+/Na+ antiporter